MKKRNEKSVRSASECALVSRVLRNSLVIKIGLIRERRAVEREREWNEEREE